MLTIERGLSQGVLGSTKSSRTRRLTLGSTVEPIESHFSSWAERGRHRSPTGLRPNPQRETHVTADALSHKFRRLGRAAGVTKPALHRLRHGVATHLVDGGKVLKAQARLGHRDPATTLRHYSHAVPLEDQVVADELDALFGDPSVNAFGTIDKLLERSSRRRDFAGCVGAWWRCSRPHSNRRQVPYRHRRADKPRAEEEPESPVGIGLRERPLGVP